MERTLERSEDKIQKICDQLKKETIQPAELEAARILEEASKKAHQIIREAEEKRERLIHEAQKEIEKERNVFRSSMQQAAKLSVESLRQEIEEKLFSPNLKNLVNEGTSQPQVIAKVIDAIVKTVEKEGIRSDLSALIPKQVPAAEVNKELSQAVIKQLKEGAVVLGDFFGGAQVKLHDRKITLDLSDKALRELLAHYVRKDFRKMIFE